MRVKIAAGIMVFIVLITVFSTCKTLSICGEMKEVLLILDAHVEAGDYAGAHRVLREFRDIEDKAEVWLTAFVERNYIFELQNNCASFESFINEDNYRDFLADSAKAKATLEIISDTMTQIF